jgi:poly(3-hydroxybutyrate) depolymerase
MTSNPVQELGKAHNQLICVDGVQRSYLLFLPSNYGASSAPRPLIFSFHGGTRNSLNQLRLDRLTDPFFNTDAIVAYPQGLGVSMSISVIRPEQTG